jgi:hypothetical protein
MESKDNKTTQQRNRREMLSEEQVLEKAYHQRSEATNLLHIK